MISDWRRGRRIGPPALSERLEMYWKLPIIAVVSTSVLVGFAMLINTFRDVGVNPRLLVFSWCFLFSLMMLVVSESLWRNGFWRELFVLIVIAALIVIGVWFFALPAATGIGLIAPELSISPVAR